MAILAHETESARAEPSVRERYLEVKARIAAAAERVGRRPSDVILVAVTKFASIEQIRELVMLGHADLGENRVQVLSQHAALVEEFLVRHRQIPAAARGTVPEKVRWHLIGTLQRNKVRKVVDLCRLVHSVDSLKLAEEIQAVASARGREEPVEVLVQVNVAGEKQKSGVAPAAARHLVEQIDSMFGLRVRGLMCMAPLAPDPERQAPLSRPVFERCAELFEDIRSSSVGHDRFDILSMGMSGDYEVAIECGANIVRVGTSIFGERELDEDPSANA